MHSEVFFFRQSRFGSQFELLALNLELILSLNDLVLLRYVKNENPIFSSASAFQRN